MVSEGDKVEVPEWQEIAEKMLSLPHGMMNHIPRRFHEAPPELTPVIRRLQETHFHLHTVNALIARAGGRLLSRQLIAAILYGRGFSDQPDYGKLWNDECNRLQVWRQNNIGKKA